MQSPRNGLWMAAAVAAATVCAGVATAGPASRAKDPTGTWFLKTPAGLSAFYTFHRHGTLTGVANTIFAGSPNPPGPPTTKSMDNGVWRRSRGAFESVLFRFHFDPDTGEASGFTRIRFEFDIDKGSDSGSGSFFVARWFCLMPTECPDPRLEDPDVAEFAPPGNTFVISRVRVP